ncbi:LysM peptidoglycan-binding domain-containing protein [Candidatus Pacearchaeota archaeon]|nr:LysM peptidoglycan-binding domain-containing protein [Candidatus Pacearchaeota archaeon]
MITRREILKSGLIILAAPKILFADSPSELDYLDVYDSQIDRTLSYFSGLHNLSPEKNLIKAMIAVESGAPQHRQTAFRYDPMQIASDGNARELLANKKENTELIGDFSCLERTKNAVPRNGKWDYTGTGMNAELGIFGGIGWLYHKAADYRTRTIEEPMLLEYEIKECDSFSKIAPNLGTTISTLRKYNPNLKPRRLQIGQKIKYKKARRETFISGFNDFNRTFPFHNGANNPRYKADVLRVRKELDRNI